MRTLAESEQFIQALSGIFRDAEQYLAIVKHTEEH